MRSRAGLKPRCTQPRRRCRAGPGRKVDAVSRLKWGLRCSRGDEPAASGPACPKTSFLCAVLTNFSIFFYCGKIYIKFTILTTLSVPFNGIKYTHIVVNYLQHPSPELFSSCKTETLSPLNTNSPVSPPLAPGNHSSTFCRISMNFRTLSTS